MPLNSKEEIRFEKLREECRSLGVPAPPEIHIQFVVRDKDGHIITSDTQRGHSWTRNFYNWMFSQMTQTPTTGENNFGAGIITSKMITGDVANDPGSGAGISGRTIYFSHLFGYGADVGVSDAGIVIGTSDTAFSAEHHQLGALITSGTGAGQMLYGRQFYPESQHIDKRWITTRSRDMVNNSGADITVKETGLYWKTTDHTRATFFWFMFNQSWMTERSVLNPSFLIPDGGRLSISYEISMDFSAID